MTMNKYLCRYPEIIGRCSLRLRLWLRFWHSLPNHLNIELIKCESIEHFNMEHSDTLCPTIWILRGNSLSNIEYWTCWHSLPTILNLTEYSVKHRTIHYGTFWHSPAHSLNFEGKKIEHWNCWLGWSKKLFVNFAIFLNQSHRFWLGAICWSNFQIFRARCLFLFFSRHTE